MTEIIRRYQIDTFKLHNVNNDSINPSVIDIINNLAKLVGAPEYRKTPVFKKKNKSNEQNWENIRNFKVTTVTKNDDGINKNISEIRIVLNKLTKKNYDDISKKILDLLKNIVENKETTEEDLNNIGKSIFEISTTNKFWSQLYSKIYKDILEEYPVYKTICEKNLDEFIILFNNVRYIDAEKDYDMFCTINKENEKRKALSKFFVNLMNQGIISINAIGNIVLNLIQKFKNNIDTPDHIEILDEIGENITIFIQDGNDKFDEEFEKYEELKDFVSYVTELDYTEHVSVSSKITFKFMDLEEELI